MGKMMINKKPTQDKVQKHIANWTITKKKQSTEVNMGNEKNLQ